MLPELPHSLPPVAEMQWRSVVFGQLLIAGRKDWAIKLFSRTAVSNGLTSQVCNGLVLR